MHNFGERMRFDRRFVGLFNYDYIVYERVILVNSFYTLFYQFNLHNHDELGG